MEDEHRLVGLDVLEVVDQGSGNASVKRSKQASIVERALRFAERCLRHIVDALKSIQLTPGDDSALKQLTASSELVVCVAEVGTGRVYSGDKVCFIKAPQKFAILVNDALRRRKLDSAVPAHRKTC